MPVPHAAGLGPPPVVSGSLQPSQGRQLDKEGEPSWDQLRLSLRHIYNEQVACLAKFDVFLQATENPIVTADGADVQPRGGDAPEAPMWHLPSVGWRTTDSSHRDAPGDQENVQRYEFSNEAVEPTSCAPVEQPMTERVTAESKAPTGSKVSAPKGYSVGRSMMWREMLTGASHSLAADFSHHLDGKKFQCIRRCCLRLVSKKWFDYMMGLIIFANAISVGYEIQASLTQVESWMYWLDFVFVLIYFVELIIRLLAWGRKCFKDPWCILDMVLVSMGLFSLFTEHVGEKVQELESLLVVRSLRLLRLIRALRLLKQFRTVWRLVNGLLTSANAMVSTLVLVVLSLYIAACLGIEIITKDSDLTSRAETASIVSQHFGSLSSTLLTLTAFVTVDSISPIYGPLIASKPGLAGYFFFIVLFVSIALMNLVTAVLVEGALANASADKEMERMDLREKLRSEMPRLSQIFDEIDKDSSGTLTMDEMAMVPVDIIPEELRSKSRVSSMQEVFEMLDVDGGGELTREEFVDGLLNLFMHDDPATSVQTLRLLRKVDMKVMHLTHEIQEVVGRARNP